MGLLAKSIDLLSGELYGVPHPAGRRTAGNIVNCQH
jgi:hypothetical protein